MNKKLFIYALLGLSFSLCACSPNNHGVTDGSGVENEDDDGIVGGRKVEASDLVNSSIVAVYDTKYKMLCTGTLIKKDIILTAAHCVSPEPLNMVAIFADDIHDAKDVVHIEKAIVNPNWKKDKSNSTNTGDLAILKLQAEAPESYKPAKILSAKTTLMNQESVLLAGYGISDSTKNSGAGELRKVTTTIKNAAFSDTEIEIDQTNGKGACHGDSGGPAFITVKNKLFLWGVTSRGEGSTAAEQCHIDSIYTKVNSYRAWIASQVRSLK